MSSCSSINRDLANASNLLIGGNPPYTLKDFQEQYPQFDGIVPDTFLNMYINLAWNSLQKARWHDAWEIAMGWFVAHFATLYLDSMAPKGSSAGRVLAAGKAKGLATSKSVDGVSVAYDYNTVTQDLDGWAEWKLTIFGQQLAGYAKMLASGGAFIV